jgi:hypothetical protein
MPPDTAIRPPRVPRRPSLRWSLSLLVAAVLLVVAIGGLAPLVFEDQPTVRHVTFVNPTVYAIDIEVTGATRGGWLPLVTVERGATTVVDDVIDQGPEWILHFRSQGYDGGELSVARAELVRSGWHVVVPAAVGEQLASQGKGPAPAPANS